jgi:hypothetical protein
MANLFESVEEFFTGEGWSTEQVDDGTLRMSFRGDNATWTCFARVRAAQGQVTFYSVAPVTAPPAQRPAVAELVARANFGTVVGNLELDFADGEIRYRTSLDLGPEGLDGVPFARLFGRLVGANLRMMDRHLPALLDVIGGRAPAEALADLDAASS